MFEHRRARRLTPEEAHRALRRALSDAGRGPQPSRRALVALAERAGQAAGNDPMARSARASAERYLAALRSGRRVKTSTHKMYLIDPEDPAIAIEVDAVFGGDLAFWERELHLRGPDDRRRQAP